MKTIADEATRAALIGRLSRLTPNSERQWGTMTAHQMLLHVGDAVDAVLGRRPFGSRRPQSNRLLKFFALWVPTKWPRGIKGAGARAADSLAGDQFAGDLARILAAHGDLPAAPAATLAPAHPMFGAMSRSDWMRWAWLHADHHLRQFGL